MWVTKIYNQIIAQPTKFYEFAVQDVAKYYKKRFIADICHVGGEISQGGGGGGGGGG
jgi:hypothetical protein